MSVDGGWIGDPESTPCEMGGDPLVDYGIDPGIPTPEQMADMLGVSRERLATVRRIMSEPVRTNNVAVRNMNIRLERAAFLVEKFLAKPATKDSYKNVAASIRGLKEILPS